MFFTNKKLVWIIGLLVVLVTGCGTAETGNSGAKDERNSNDQIKKENPLEDAPIEENTIIRIPEQNLQYKINGKSMENTAFIKHNNQHIYSLYVLQDYTLASENENSDMLVYNKDNDVYMRIEFIANYVNWDKVEQDTKQQLSKVDSQVEQIPVPKEDLFKDSIGFEASNEELRTTVYLVKSLPSPLKLTIFTKSSEDHREAFIQMGKTLMMNKVEE